MRSRRGAGGRRTTLTSRAAVLALVLCALVVMLALPVQQYLEQRVQIGRARAANAQLQQQVDALTAQQKQWDDPDFVRQQARERLFYVMPGQTAYVVVGGTKDSASVSGAHQKSSPSSAPAAGSWYARLWGSVTAAGDPPKPHAPGHG